MGENLTSPVENNAWVWSHPLVRTYGEVFRELMRRAGERPEDVIAATGLAKMTVYDVLNDKRGARRDTLDALARHFKKKLADVEAMRDQPEEKGAPIFVRPDVAEDFSRLADDLGLSPTEALRSLIEMRRNAAGAAASRRPPRQQH